MADDEKVPQPHGGALRPWRPGESGNPRGSSKKRRQARFLNSLLAEAMDDLVTPRFAELLEETLGVEIPEEQIAEGVTLGEVLAMDLLIHAITTREGKARDRVIALTPSKVELEDSREHGQPKSGEFIPAESEGSDAEEVPEGIVH